jgi:hypothetical protein
MSVLGIVASRECRSGDGRSRDGRSRDGRSRDGRSRDGRSRDGRSRDGRSRNCRCIPQTTRCHRPTSQFAIHFCSCPSMPWAFSFFSSLACGTLSKALAKSRNIASNASPLSTAWVAFSKNSNRLVEQLLPG